ncbi:MAG: LemA family protein [Alphaproteobacteria bacterium]|jgi:LemA protein|nr:LemA family protein [Alphaproteobacteria bacterium]
MEMQVIFWLILALVVIFYVLYTRLIRCRNKVQESMADIDVQLKKRYDLIPNMLNMAAKFMEHEKNIMTQLADVRTRAMQTTFVGSPQEKMELENQLNQKLQDFKFSLENYPDLKSNQTMMTAMQSMNEVEEHIAAARRFYNANVNELKNMCEIFPSSLVASVLSISWAATPFFEVSDNERQPIDSKDYFK